MLAGILLALYGRTAQTRRAHRLARILRRLGHDTVFLVKEMCKGPFEPAFDKLVLREQKVPRSKQSAGFKEWVRRQDYLVWIGPPELGRVNTAKDCDVQTIGLFDWFEHADPDYAAAFRALDTLACPTQCSSRAAAQYYPQVEYVGWTGDLPRTRMLRQRQPGSLLLHLPGGEGEKGALEVLDWLLANQPNSRFSILYQRGQVSSQTQARLQRLSRSPQHIRLLPLNRLDNHQLGALLLESSLYLELALRSSFASLVWSALQSGLPTVAYDLPPFSELIRHKKNGLLATCRLTYNRLGAPVAVPNAKAYCRVLEPLLADWSGAAAFLEPQACLPAEGDPAMAWKAILKDD